MGCSHWDACCRGEQLGAAPAPSAEAATLPQARGRASEHRLSALDMLPIIKFANELKSNIYLLAGLGVSQSPYAQRPAVAGSPAPRCAVPFLARKWGWESAWLRAATKVHLGHSVWGTTASIKIAPVL